jgi:hypothetical protein
MSAQKLDDSEVEQLLRSGLTQLRVVEILATQGVSVSQSAISQAISTGRIKVDTGRTSGGIPWRLKPEHRHRHAARMLRTQARLDKGLPIGKSLTRQVEAWREALEADDSVVHYDPDTEEGFWRVPRRPGIDLWWYRDPGIDDNGYPVRGLVN